jgi:putative transposase
MQNEICVHQEASPAIQYPPMCNMLAVHPSGFYAWLKQTFSKVALEDERQTQLLKEAWEGSGKVYGYPLADR